MKKKILIFILFVFSTCIFAQEFELWGMTQNGGINNGGVIYKTDENGNNLQVVYNFIDSTGTWPRSSLVYGENGCFYGITLSGGANNQGGIFKFDAINNQYYKLYDFIEPEPYVDGALILADNNKLYGLLNNLSPQNEGTLFEFDLNSNTYKADVIFNNSQYLQSSILISPTLTQAYNKKIYGFAYYGGTSNTGTIFEYDYTLDTLVILKSFDSYLKNPIGQLIEVDTNIFIGTCRQPNNGAIFKYDASSSVIETKAIIKDCSTNNYANYYGRISLHSNGKIYGISNSQGYYNMGFLFEYDIINDTIVSLFDFDGVEHGSKPWDGVIESSNGKLYGVTYSGGANDLGIIYEYDLNNDTLIKKFDFDSINGASPTYNRLILCNICYPKFSNINIITCDSYTVPSGDETYYTNGIYIDTIQSSCGNDSIITINLTINNSNSISEDTIICSGESYTFPDNVTIDNITSQVTHTSNFQTINSCDSTIETTVNINSIDNTVIQDSTSLTANAIGVNYQWINCNNSQIIPGETNQTYILNGISGSFAVIIDDGTCIDTSDCFTITEIGIVENEFNSLFKVYPNPTSNNIYIDLGEVLSQVTINIKSLKGQLISTKKYNNTELINISLTVNGYYIIEILSDNGKFAKIKVLKE